MAVSLVQALKTTCANKHDTIALGLGRINRSAIQITNQDLQIRVLKTQLQVSAFRPQPAAEPQPVAEPQPEPDDEPQPDDEAAS